MGEKKNVHCNSHFCAQSQSRNRHFTWNNQSKFIFKKELKFKAVPYTLKKVIEVWYLSILLHCSVAWVWSGQPLLSECFTGYTTMSTLHWLRYLVVAYVPMLWNSCTDCMAYCFKQFTICSENKLPHTARSLKILQNEYIVLFNRSKILNYTKSGLHHFYSCHTPLITKEETLPS